MTGIALVYTILEIANEYTLRREDGDAECISSSPERMVEPVVITSSTIRMCRFSSSSGYFTVKEPIGLSLRSVAFFLVCVGWLCGAMRLSPVGMPVTRLRPMAISCD